MARIRRGDDGLGRQIQEWADGIVDWAKVGVMETAAVIEASAKSGAPVDDGFLRQSIETAHLGAAHARVTIGAAYAAYVIFGTGVFATQGSRAHKIPWVYFNEKLGHYVTTRGQRPQDFWTPALLSGERYFNNYFK